VVAAKHPEAYAEAHDLVESRLALDGITRQWKRAGLERDRGFLAARVDDKARGIAVCETAAAGLHLYGLFDVVRLYALDRCDDSVRIALLEAARTWYRERGKARLAYFCETPNFAHGTAADFDDMGEADMTILAAELMPEQLLHAWEITAPKDAS
jgi:hypothetical protein